MNIGDRIKAAREAAGYTLEELGKLCGTTKQTIYKYETGVITNIPLDKLERIGAVLDKDPAYFVGWNRNPGLPADISSEEKEILEQYRALSPTFQRVFRASLLTAAQAAQDPDESGAGQ